MDFFAAHADAVLTALLFLLGQIISVAVLKNDIGWIKSNLRHHISNDDGKFNALTARIDNLLEGTR